MAAGTSRVVAAGTKLFAMGGAEGSATQVAGVVSLGGPDATADSIDTTELDPYAGGTIPTDPEFFKTFIAGWRDGGSMTLVCNFTEAGKVRMQLFFDKGYTVSWYFSLRNGTQIPFSGFVSALGQTQEKEGLVQMPISIKVSGKIGVTTAGV